MITPNRYPGTCYRCGGSVPAGEGEMTLESFPGQRWAVFRGQRNHYLVEHPECAVKYAGTNVHYLCEPAHESP